MRRVCLNSVHDLAKTNDKIVFVGSDLGAGTLKAMQDEMPDRFFMEGIAEQYVIGMAAGLAMDGFIPYVNTIAPFITRRALEQVVVDLCLHDLPVRLIGNGGGLVYAPLGPTHQAIEDIGVMRAVPNMTVLVPTDKEQMAALMPKTVDWSGPIYIRLAKGGDPIVDRPSQDFEIGKAYVLSDPGEVVLIATGVMTHKALDAAAALSDAGLNAGVVDVPTLKPFDRETILAASANARLVVTIEEHIATGGLGSAVAETFADTGQPMPAMKRLCLPDAFCDDYGTQNDLLASFGLDVAGIVSSVRTAINQLP